MTETETQSPFEDSEGGDSRETKPIKAPDPKPDGVTGSGTQKRDSLPPGWFYNN